MTAKWIETALALAAAQSWSKAINMDSAKRDLEDWASDDMFSREQQVRDRLCQWADSQIQQLGKANFRCTLPKA